ncbi:alpha/beta hydrolase [Mycolicibacterium sp. BiH015]|uniref:alpha/beta fold hydrolase n=1 Tax=Mycolicibacterium sp. BiH015 TaxID=3018808 RepID=UPI0022E60210|nr:alpha/beta hydrolase [Mycolicibacterium sp. BiH015]MDA2895413.1 alpha/beta hydrolase [Mycolicibacterium sp. BiH015]
MDLFVRECGPSSGPPIVFLHGGRLSGWSWRPVVERLPGFHCLVPDLPQFGRSADKGPFAMSAAAEAVADVIRSRAGMAHVVGYSLGAQVGLQLLATQPGLVARAVLCGAMVNRWPVARPARALAGRCARAAGFRRLINRSFAARDAPVPVTDVDDYLEDLALSSDVALAHIVMASVGFTRPEGLSESAVPTLLLSGTEETLLVRRTAGVLAKSMPYGIRADATGMRHDWPLRCPGLFAATVAGWLAGGVLPAEIRPARGGRVRRLGRSRR